MSKLHCDKCKDYRDFDNGVCEVCDTEHPAMNKTKPINNYHNNPEYHGLPHDSDCFWVG